MPIHLQCIEIPPFSIPVVSDNKCYTTMRGATNTDGQFARGVGFGGGFLWVLGFPPPLRIG